VTNTSYSPAVERDGLVRARSVLLAVLAAEVAVLVVTGVALYFLHRPAASAGWSDIAGGELDGEVRLAQALRLVHRLVSSLTVFTAVAAGVVVGLRAVGRRWAGPALGLGLALTTVLASFTGYLLPWDQLALRAVTVDSDYRGFAPLFDSVVRFVLIGGVEVTPGTVLRWLFVHAAVLGPVLVVLLVVARRRVRTG
jgi:quinol-cytochrome oxidoreductase complex cytochrome b subunit